MMMLGVDDVVRRYDNNIYMHLLLQPYSGCTLFKDFIISPFYLYRWLVINLEHMVHRIIDFAILLLLLLLLLL